MNHQVQFDLEKVFNNAIENVDEYEDKDLSGKQIKRNTSAIADKINYLLTSFLIIIRFAKVIHTKTS